MPRSTEPLDAYIDTINKMEPDIAPVDLTAAAASIAISLKRIADALETGLVDTNEYGERGFALIGRSILTGLRG